MTVVFLRQIYLPVLSLLKTRNFDIYVAQPFALVARSKGVCVKFNCPLSQSGKRKKRQAVPSLISKICDIFINDALAQDSNPVPSDVIKSAKSTCEYDINTTLDAGVNQNLSLEMDCFFN